MVKLGVAVPALTFFPPAEVQSETIEPFLQCDEALKRNTIPSLQDIMACQECKEA
jgi:hypothetical protein